MKKGNTNCIPEEVKQTSLFYIFLTFLKLGATAFGGYMSLVAIVQKQLVEIDRRLKEEDLLDGVSLCSILPGPVATNVIVYVGYRLRGVTGAVLAFLGIILPSMLLVIGLSWFYFTYGNVPAVKSIFAGIMPAITALVLTVAIGMAGKTMKLPAQWVIGVISAGLLAGIGGFGLTFGLIVASGVAGSFLFYDRTMEGIGDRVDRDGLTRRQWVVYGLILFSMLLLFFWGRQDGQEWILLRLFSTFTGVSLTLFGGGYVVIPALHELIVDNLGWLTSAEFADGIAIGQVTPGPIFITATFIGYKVGGVIGALLATVGIFTPPAILTVLLSRFVVWLNHSTRVKAVMKGIRAAVIGMIFASVLTIGQTMEPSWFSAGLFLLVFVISYRYTISPVYLILGAGLAGFILF